MAGSETVDTAIIGAGVIGLTIALRLAADGHQVTLIDPNEPGSGASYGNAGTLADYAVMPVGTPSVLAKLPALLFDRDSPLSIRTSAIPSLAPWLIRFAHQSLPHNARRNTAAIAALLAPAVDAWRELAAEIGATDQLRQNGCLYLYPSKAAFAAAQSDVTVRRRFGIEQTLLTPDEVHRIEPGLPESEGGGILFPNAVNLADPGLMMMKLAAAAASASVKFLRAAVRRVERRDGRVHLTLGSTTLVARRVVIAAGAHSKHLAAQAGDRVPLDTERGYHLEFDMPDSPVSRPVCPTALGLYLVPMTGRLRVAGTVELGGLTAPPNPHRLQLLERGARSLLPGLGPPIRSWMGFRPSMPNSVPVIRPSRRGDDILLAFGHGHLGLTLAPVTARLISGLVGSCRNLLGR